MDETKLFVLSLFIGALGLLISASFVYVGWRLFRLERDWAEIWTHFLGRPMDPNAVTVAADEYWSRRNEFWTSIGQFAVSILVVVVIAILLLTTIISPEAGLPILAGVGGFAIGKGVQTGRSLAAGRREQ